MHFARAAGRMSLCHFAPRTCSNGGAFAICRCARLHAYAVQDEHELLIARKQACQGFDVNSMQPFGVRLTRVRPTSDTRKADPVESKSQGNGCGRESESDGGGLHFPPGFVLRVPFELMRLAAAAGLSFSSVVYGKYTVHLVVRDFLHCFLQVEEHGSALDFVAFYRRGHPAARPWLEQIVRMIPMAVRSELRRSACLMLDGAGLPAACCSYHYEVAADLPECVMTPLCPNCLLNEAIPVRRPVHVRAARSLSDGSASSSPAGLTASSVPSLSTVFCQPSGHSLTASLVCLGMELDCATQAADISCEHFKALFDELTIVKRKLDDFQVRVELSGNGSRGAVELTLVPLVYVDYLIEHDAARLCSTGGAIEQCEARACRRHRCTDE